MGRTIKTRHIQKDIKVLDKTVTAAEHMKGAYIRTRDSAEQTQVKEQGNPVGYAEDQVMEKGERRAFRLFFFVRYRKDLPAERTDEKPDGSADWADSRRAGHRRKGDWKERSADPGTSKADGKNG